MNKSLSVLFVLALGACDIDGQPCGLANLDACDPAPVPPTCGALIPTAGTVIWVCNLPAIASDSTLPMTDDHNPCGLVFCEYVTQAAQAVEQEAAMWFTSQGFTLPGAGQTQIVCKRTPASTLNGLFDLAAIFSPDQCVTTKPAPCGMFGDVCGSVGSPTGHPQCCQAPEAPFDLICNEGTEETGGTCCIQNGEPCQSGYPNAGCCPANEDHPADACGDGNNSDSAHLNVCCGSAGAPCYPDTDSYPGESDALCCSGECYQLGPNSWACSTY